MHMHDTDELDPAFELDDTTHISPRRPQSLSPQFRQYSCLITPIKIISRCCRRRNTTNMFLIRKQLVLLGRTLHAAIKYRLGI